MSRQSPDLRYARPHVTVGGSVSVWIAAIVGTLIAAFLLWVFASLMVPVKAGAHEWYRVYLSGPE